jgi:hypothetical protein
MLAKQAFAHHVGKDSTDL